MRLPASAVHEAVTKAKGGHFQLACAAAFEGAHHCDCDTGINHPNQVCRFGLESAQQTQPLRVDDGACI